MCKMFENNNVQSYKSAIYTVSTVAVREVNNKVMRREILEARWTHQRTYRDGEQMCGAGI